MKQMTRRTFIKTTVAGAVAGTASDVQGLNENGKPVRPNVLILMTDQQRFDAIRYVQNLLPGYKGKVKINTPNLDRLLNEGAYFANAYTQCAVCAPVRSVLRTGCTVERCGVQANELSSYEMYNRTAQFRNKVNRAETFEQILVEECGYQAAHFGKWHMPDRFNFRREYTQNDNGSGTDRNNVFCATDKPEDRVIRFNDVDWNTNTLCYTYDRACDLKYKRGLKAYVDKYGNGISKQCSHLKRPGYGPQYHNSYSGYPYDSIAIDSLNTIGHPAGQPPPGKFRSQPNLAGRDCLGDNLTPSFFTAEGARLAIREFAGDGKPFIVTASFHNPHAPMIATGKYFDNYWDKRKSLFVAPSHEDPMVKSDYANANGRKDLLKTGLRYDKADAIQEWTVPYYALCEEIDFHVGRLLAELKTHGLEENTLVVFLSDHGEMLGAHGLREKNIFLEESARVPLLLKFPPAIKAGTQVETPVALLDVFATILDYCGATEYDHGDGRSLRRHVEKTSWNKAYDDEAIVTEWDFRAPKEDGRTLERQFGSEPNFMVRKGPWKLMMTKKESSPLHDMLYNLENDPYETDNLIYAGDKAKWLTEAEIVGKAEHLKALLIDWMIRMDGNEKYYSDPKWNAGEGRGDIEEIRLRRKWKSVDFWVSDRNVSVGPLVRENGRYRKNLWIYFGSTTPGNLTIESITIQGGNGLSLEGFTKGELESGNYAKCALSVNSKEDLPVSASIVIAYHKNEKRMETIVNLS